MDKTNFYTQSPLLIFSLLTLLAVRFILVPVLDWQNEQLWEVQQLNKRLILAQDAVNNIERNKQEYENLNIHKSRLSKMFFAPSPKAQFQLERQQWLEDRLNKYQLKATNVGWSFSTRLLQAPVIRYQMDVSFEGDAQQVPLFQQDLESQSEWLQIERLNVTFNKQKGNDLGQMKGTIEISFFQLANDSGLKE